MQRTFFEIILDSHKVLPIYLFSVGSYFEQNEIDRPDGYPVYQWIQCIDGKGEVFINDNRFIMEKGMGMLIYKGDRHRYKPISDKWITSWVSFDGFSVRTLLENMEIHKSSYYKTINNDIINESIDKLINECIGENDYIKLSCYSYEFILNLTKFINISMINGKEEKSKLKPVIRYIRENYSKVLTLEELANCINISQQYLCRLFTEELGRRPIEYVNEVRIQKSKELMLNTSLTIGEISEKVGFDSFSYFGKYFKKVENMTAGQFRKQFK